MFSIDVKRVIGTDWRGDFQSASKGGEKIGCRKEGEASAERHKKSVGLIRICSPLRVTASETQNIPCISLYLKAPHSTLEVHI